MNNSCCINLSVVSLGNYSGKLPVAVFNGLPAQEAEEAGRSNRKGIKLSVLINFLYSSLNICYWLLLRTEYSARWTFGLTQCGSSYIFMCLVTASSVTVELHKTPLWIYVHLKENRGENLRKNLSLSLALFSEHKLLL